MRRHDRSSVEAVGRVQTLDGSALVLRVWRDPVAGWERSPISRLTPDTIEVLREERVRIVRLRRHRHVAEVALAWFPAASRSHVTQVPEQVVGQEQPVRV